MSTIGGGLDCGISCGGRMAACPGESQKYGHELCWGLGYRSRGEGIGLNRRGGGRGGREELVNICIINLYIWMSSGSVSAWGHASWHRSTGLIDT